MEKSILLHSLFTPGSNLDQASFIEVWNYCLEQGLRSELVDSKFTLFINENVFATFDGENLEILASLDSEAKSIAYKELEKLGFLRPLAEEILFYPATSKIDAPYYISSYVVSNEEHEIVKAIKLMNLDTPVKAKATRKDERNYVVEVQINQEENSLLKTKKIGATAVKCALLCLCVGWMNLAQAIEDKNPDDLHFISDSEDQLIRYKKIIDKHIQRSNFNQNVELYQSQADYERNQQRQLQKAASAGVREILNTDYRFEEKLRNKLNQLEDKFFSSDKDDETPNGLKNSTIGSTKDENSNVKIKNKVRVFQGKAQVEAEYSNFIKMKVEANAFATDKLKANVQTRTLELKELGMQVYGQVRYLSSDQTVISEIRSGFGKNLDLTIYNKKTNQKDRPSNENVIEMRYQLDF